MERPKLKLAGAILILLVLTVVFFWCRIFMNTFIGNEEDAGAEMSRIKGISASSDKLAALNSDVENRVLQSGMTKASLTAETLRALSVQSWNGKVRLFNDGALIEAADKEADIPDGLPDDLMIDPDSIKGESGYVPGEKYYLYYSRVNGPFYYVEWESTDSFYNRVKKYIDLDAAINSIRDSMGIYLLLFDRTPSEDGTHKVLYKSELFENYETAEELGISKEMLEAASKVTSEDIAAERLHSDAVYIREGDKTYEVYLRKNSSDNNIIAFVFPYTDAAYAIHEQSVFFSVLFFILGAVLITWAFSVLILVRVHILNDEQAKAFSPKTVGRKMLIITAVFSLVLALSTTFAHSLVKLYGQYRFISRSLDMLESKVDENKNHIKIAERIRKAAYVNHGTHIAEFLSEYPELMTKEELKTYSDMIGTDYLLVFDPDGNEILSDSKYSGLTLGTDPNSTTYEFRRLATGVSSVVHDTEESELTGLSHVVIGVSFPEEEETGGYRSLLLAVPPSEIYDSALETVSDIMSTMTIDGTTALAVNPENKDIVYASSEDLIGKDAQMLGLTETVLQDGYFEFFTFNNTPYYGAVSDYDGLFFVYAVERVQTYGTLGKYMLITFILSFLLLGVAALYMSFGYKKNFGKYSKTGIVLDDGMEEITLAGGRSKLSMDPSKRWLLSVSSHGRRTPLHNAIITLQTLFVFFAAAVGISVLRGATDSQRSVFMYIIGRKWTRGFNSFAIADIILLFVVVFLSVIVIKFVLFLLSTVLGTKGETICRLLYNLVNYIAIAVFFYYMFYFLGFDSNTLLASLGLATFALSLGAKDLVTDILAGLSIVFEGDYQVGDIIDVGGYRGTVLEIGVRTTKLEGRGGNIKIIGNRDVKNVINMTRKTSWYPLEIKISLDQDLEAVESLFNESLPAIGESVPEIISGPFYRGILSMGNGSVTLSIITECNEADFYKVQRSVNHEIRKLLTSHGIKIL